MNCRSMLPSCIEYSATRRGFGVLESPSSYSNGVSVPESENEFDSYLSTGRVSGSASKSQMSDERPVVAFNAIHLL